MRGFIAVCAAVLLLGSYARGESGVELLDGKMSLDAQLFGTAHFYRLTTVGLSSNDVTFERAAALAGLTGRISPAVSIRAYFDVGGHWGGRALDMYVDLASRNGLEARFGQFLLPLGFDYMTDYVRQPLVNNSLLMAYAKANGGRDIGAMGGWQNRRLSIAAAIVNGAGANAGDNNSNKDVCMRIAARPVDAVDMVLALRGYYGWPASPDSVWRTVAAEARMKAGPIELQSEFQSHYGSDVPNSAAYLQAAWRAANWEPAARFDLVLPRGRHPEWMVTAGLNLCPVHENLKIMLDCSYRRNYQDNWSVLGFLLRAQAWL